MFGLTSLFPVPHSKRAQQCLACAAGDWTRQLDLRPFDLPLHVSAPTNAVKEMEMEEGLRAHVEDTGTLLDGAVPGPYLGEHVTKVIQKLGRAVRHH
jgi:hypothetical protein